MSATASLSSQEPALLVLADGSVFRGVSVGASGRRSGEVVFNTAMTGYQEILTDPSYCRQIVTLTYPHVGNVGVNAEDDEAAEIFAAGMIIRDLPRLTSSWRATIGFADYLKQRGVVAMAGVDTRRLTRLLREKGAQSGCIWAGEEATFEAAHQHAQQFPGLNGMDLAQVVSCQSAYDWRDGVWNQGAAKIGKPPKYRVVAYDFGIKRNILRMLVSLGCEVRVVPATTGAEEVLATQPDGIFLSNGPGDPQACGYAIEAIRTFLEARIPVFGICLGHQLLALACGANTHKMKFGHHGANHPVQDQRSGKVIITSQNHGFAVDLASLPITVSTTHVSLFDGTLQGIELKGHPAFSFQGHPEASPGPHDASGLFERFMDLMHEYRD